MKRIFFWGRLALGAALIGYLLYMADLGELRIAVSRGSIGLLVAAYLIGIVDRVLMAYKWNLLLRAQAIVISLADATITYVMSTFLGLFLPSTVGGDAIRVFVVSKFGYSAADATATIIIERALGMVALIVMVVASIIAGGFMMGAGYLFDLWNILIIVGITGLIALILIVLSFSNPIRQRMLSYFQPDTSTIGENVRSRWDESVWSVRVTAGAEKWYKVKRFLGQLGESYGKFRYRRGLLALFFGLSLLENLFPIAWSYMLASAFQLQISLLDCFVVVPSVLILRRLPISIDGIGIHQTAFVYLLSLTGVPTAQGLLLGIATHLLATLLVLPGGLFYMLRGVDVAQLERGVVT